MQPRIVEFPSSLDPFGVGRRTGLVRGCQADQENDGGDGADGTEIWFSHDFLKRSELRSSRSLRPTGGPEKGNMRSGRGTRCGCPI